MEFKLLHKQSTVRLVPVLIAFLVMLLGCFVMMGWFLKNQSLIQINENFVPMQFNTALLFLVSGVGLWALIEKYIKATHAIGFIIIAVSFVTLIQYALSINLGIDELFIEHYIDTHTSTPGRMAPNTAVCFLLLGAQFALLKRLQNNHWTLHFSIISSAAILALSTVAIAGYFNGVPSSYGWGQYTHMALHTSIGFICLSLGLILHFIARWQHSVNPINVSVFVSIFIISVAFSLWQAIRGQEVHQINSQLTFQLKNLEADVKQNIFRFSESFSNIMPGSVSLSEREKRVLFDTYLKSNPSVLALAKLDSNKKIIFSFPEKDSLFIFESFKGLIDTSIKNEVGVSDVSPMPGLGTYFVMYANSTGSGPGSNTQVQLISWDRFIGPLIQRYETLGFEINISNLTTSIYSSTYKVTKNIVSQQALMSDLGWTITIKGNAKELKDGSLANAVFIFGLIFSVLVAAVSQLFLNARGRATVLTEEISARKEAHKRISEAKLVTDLASKVAGLGIWTWDLSTNQLTWDENMYRIYHLPLSLLEHQLLYENWINAVHPDDQERTEKSLLEAVEKKQDWSREFRLVLKNNTIKYIFASATIVFDEDGLPIKMIGGNLDITELRETQERLVGLKEIADKNSLAKSQFLANMSHEIRTPMNGVLGITDLLQQTKLSPLQQEYLELIKNSASSLLRILNDILDHSKIEAGMLELVEEHFSLDNRIGDLLKGFAPTAHQKMIELEYNIDAAVPSCIKADAMRVGQIIFNLVGNAVKFTETGEIIVEVSGDGNMDKLKVDDTFILHIAIKDTGIGISKNKLEGIFEPFGQADNTTTRRFGGTGLGLPIVKQLVHLMNGELVVDSKEFIGSLFKVSIPVKVGDEQFLNDEVGHSHIINNFDFTGISCLAVDDNAVNRKWLNNMITSWGCKSIIAGSTEQALALYQSEIEKQEKIDVLIIDRDMPNGDGFHLIEQLKQKYKDLPRTIMMLNSNDIEDDLQKIKDHKVDNYLLKPVKQSEVFNMITAVMEFDRPDLHQSDKDELPHPDKLLNILVAEDNPINSRLVHDILTYRGHNSTLVFNGKQAVEQYKGEDYDVILMDVQMPEMDGLEATGLIRRFEEHRGKPPVKIIGLTAHALSGDRQICIDAGMDNYLTKPIDSKLLLTTIESYYKISSDKRTKPALTIVNKVTGKSSLNGSTLTNELPKKATLNDLLKGTELNSKNQFIWFDIDDVIKVTSGQKDTIQAMVEMTLKILPKEIEDIDELLVEESWDSLVKQLHRMKGMLSNLTGSRLQGNFLKLEKLAANEEMVPLREKWDVMKGKLNAFLDELKAYSEVINK